MAIDPAIHLAKQSLEQGNLPKAEELCRSVLGRKPHDIAANYLLGIIAGRTNRIDVAVDRFRRVVQLNPRLVEAHNHLGTALRARGSLDASIDAYREAVRIRDDFVEAHFNLGMALREAGRLEEAIAAFRRAIALKPDFLEAANDLGSALRQAGQLDEAAAILEKVVGRAPRFFNAQNNLGNVLRMLGRFEEAEAAIRAALKLQPNFPELHVNLGNVLREKGDLEGAIAATPEAIRLRPDMADAHQNLSFALLLAGRYPEGWPEHEWRWRCQGIVPTRAAETGPPWDGSKLNGRTILLHSDAGLGDAIHCLRYVPMVAERGGRIIVECQEELVRLVRLMPSVQQVITPAEPLPRFDVHCALMSLPGAFSTTLETIPSQFAYLPVDESLAKQWGKRLAQYSGPRVGVVWAGSPRNSNDPRRSIRLSMMAPLAEAADITFHSLQVGNAAEQISELPAAFRVVDHSSELADFVDTAALISVLDLVISVDTSVAHLAGGLGKPTWVMLPYVPDWRWMLGREDSPWYPTMRLFRQKEVGNWSEVTQRIARELSKLIGR